MGIVPRGTIPKLKGVNKMTIDLYNYAGDSNRISKSLGVGTRLIGALRDPSNMIDPSILIELNNVDNINYAYIPDFQRYYFVREKKAVRTGIFELTMHVDVLSSFAANILGLHAIAKRTEQSVNQSPYIIDGLQKTQAYKKIQTIGMGELIPSSLYVLITAG